MIRTLIHYSGVLLFALVFGIIPAGCVVGPDFRTPDAPVAKTYTETILPEKTASAQVPGGAEQHFISGRDIPAQWWSLFQSAALDELIRMALQESPSVALAKARLREARENRAAQFGTLFPSIDAGVSAGRAENIRCIPGTA